MCSEQDPLVHLERLQMGILEPRMLPWQQHSRFHYVSFVMYIAGAKFEEFCFNISSKSYSRLNVVLY